MPTPARAAPHPSHTFARFTNMLAQTCTPLQKANEPGLGRRECLLAASVAAAVALTPPRSAAAFVAGTDDEVSGLVVLRVAEVP